MLVYLTLPESGDKTYEFLDKIHEIADKYYPDDTDDIYVVGNSTNEYDFKKSFAEDNVVVSVLSILIVLVVLLGTFKSVGMPILLIIVIQGSIWRKLRGADDYRLALVLPVLPDRQLDTDGR